MSSRGRSPSRHKSAVQRTQELQSWSQHNEERREEVYGPVPPPIVKRRLPAEGTPQRAELEEKLRELRRRGVLMMECSRLLGYGPGQLSGLCVRLGIRVGGE